MKLECYSPHHARIRLKLASFSLDIYLRYRTYPSDLPLTLANYPARNNTMNSRPEGCSLYFLERELDYPCLIVKQCLKLCMISWNEQSELAYQECDSQIIARTDRGLRM